MTEIYPLFEELLFGEGFWLGLLIMVGLGLYVAARVKYSGLVFVIIYIFLGLEYYNKLSGSSNSMWGFIICIVAMLFAVFQLYRDIDSAR